MANTSTPQHTCRRILWMLGDQLSPQSPLLDDVDAADLLCMAEVPAEASHASAGARACPFSTLYRDILLRNGNALTRHPRMGLQYRDLQRLNASGRSEIRRLGNEWSRRLGG